MVALYFYSGVFSFANGAMRFAAIIIVKDSGIH